jgi:Protein of unknown function (DUF551)
MTPSEQAQHKFPARLQDAIKKTCEMYGIDPDPDDAGVTEDFSIQWLAEHIWSHALAEREKEIAKQGDFLQLAEARERNYKALVAKIQNTVSEFYGPGERESDFDVLDSGVAGIVRRFAEQAKQHAEERWISVDDKLPEKPGWYLAVHYVMTDNTYVRRSWFDGEWFKMNKVTHWRPLPKPPEEAQ